LDIPSKRLDDDEEEEDGIIISIDSTRGIKVPNRGQWMQKK
jgi:hypothetical protein